MRGGSLLLFFALVLFFPLPSDQIGGGFLVCYFFLSFSSFICVFGCSVGMEREACVCDHGFERSDLCAEIIIIIVIIIIRENLRRLLVSRYDSVTKGRVLDRISDSGY